MRSLGKFIADRTPKFNKLMVEGMAYHRINKAIEYLDNFIKYSCSSKTNTHLEYLGYRELPPKEEIKFLFNKTSKVVYDIADNDIYLVEFNFKYGDEELPRKYFFYVPFLSKGNVMHMSGNKFLILPVLSDKVVSIGDKIIFINILTAKYSFSRSYFSVVVDNTFHRVPIVNTELYKNQAKKLEDTTKAYTTVMHYLLANYGYDKTMMMLLGFIPKAVYDYSGNDKVVISSTGNPPHGYIRNKTIYAPTNIKFVVEPEQYNEETLYCIGNIFYIIDNFPDSVTIDELNNHTLWKRLLGEIIHSGNHGLAYITEKISAHFNDLNSNFDTITTNKLKDIDINCHSLIQLLVVIFKQFNNWIMNAEVRSLYHNKSYEIGGGKLESKVVDNIFKKYFVTRAIFSLKKDKLYVTSIEYCGDHLYSKNTSMIVQQESDFVNVAANDTNTSERMIRLNPYVTVDFKTGTILPNPLYNDIVENTDKLLSNIVLSDSVIDNDEYVSDISDDSFDETDMDEMDMDVVDHIEED